jgi:hypothetical protein
MGETMGSAKTTAGALLGMLAFGLGACSTTQERMNSWVGTTDAHLMSVWGAPDRKAKADGGIKVITYKRKIRTGRHAHTCHKTFAIDADHRIIAANTNCL